MDKRTVAVDLGLEAEKRFELECITRGIPCYKGISLSRSDFVIEINSTPLRVQVKSSDSEEADVPIKCSWGQAKTGWKSYSKKETDIIAAYVRKQSSWYIIPIEEVSDVLGFNISKTCRLSKYKDNWECSWINLGKREPEGPSVFDQSLSLQKEGYKIDQIAAKLGRNPTFIGRLLRRGRAGQKDRLAKVTKETLERMYVSEKKTMDQISAELSTSTWYIRKMFREFQISVRVNPNPAGNKGGSHFA